jgi:hypothetical protein
VSPHTPVLLEEVVAALQPLAGQRVVDGTFGAGGYARAFLERGAEVIGFDRDPSAARFAEPLVAAFPGRLQLLNRRFSEMEEGLEETGRGSCDALALDLGVSSMQLDEAERGFSFMRDGPLDMRMGDEGPSAADLVNSESEEELARIFYVYGEERNRAGSPRPSCAAGRSSLSSGRSISPRWWRRRWADEGAHPSIRRPGCSRRSESRSTKSWANSKRACAPPNACWPLAGDWRS